MSALLAGGCGVVPPESELSATPPGDASIRPSQPAVSPDPTLTPLPTQTDAHEPSAEPTGEHAAPTESLPVAHESSSPAPDALLEAIEWRTITEPFGGELAQRVSGLYLNARGETVAWGHDQEWVAAGHGEATTSFWTSPDGVAWRESKLAALGRNEFVTEVASGPRGFAAVGHAADLAAAWWSSDGDTWVRSSLLPEPSFEDEGFRSVAASEDGFLAVGQADGKAAAWWSADGRTWRRVAKDFSDGHLSDVVASPDGGFVAVGVDMARRDWNAAAWTVSPDGRDWQRARGSDALNGPEDEEMHRLWAFAGGYLAIGQQVNTQERIDCYEGASGVVASIATVELAYVCFWGFDSWRLYSSNDGLAWEMIHPDVEPGRDDELAFWEYQAVEPWGRGLVAVGAGTDWQIRVWLSADGLEWSPVGDPLLVNGEAAPEDYQRETVSDLLVAGDRLIIGGDLDTSDGYVMIGDP